LWAQDWGSGFLGMVRMEMVLSPLQVFFTGKETDRWLWTGFHFPGMDQMDGIPEKPGRYPVQRTR